MTVLVFVPNPDCAAFVVAWSRVLVDSQDSMEFVCLESDGETSTETAVKTALADEAIQSVIVTSMTTATPVADLVERCRKSKPRMLISSPFSLDPVGGRPQNSQVLTRAVPCMAIVPSSGRTLPGNVERILMIVSRGANDPKALRIAEMLGQKLNAKVSLATVEDESGPKAERAGEKAISSLLHDMGLDEEHFEVKVVVNRLRHRGILECSKGQDLIVCGKDVGEDFRLLRQSLKEPTSLIVKRAAPLRLKSLPEWIPRINPIDHAELLQDLRHGSRWNANFIAMLSLASAIATLGLMQNSPAVVIGSMLLAPMMTPMIGAGLALAQANWSLARLCAKSIALGFLLTLAVSYVVGEVAPARETLSPEVLSRGSPNVLDLMIALFAAIAATIAMARPGIAGAVAGVAIATALVPPICAIGISLSLEKFQNALGALILFSTNLVAIVIASSFTFSLLGIVTKRSLKRHRRLVGAMRLGLVVLLAILAAPLTMALYSQLDEGRTQPAVFPVTRAVAEALRSHVKDKDGVDITFLARPSVAEGVVIYLAADRDQKIEPSFADELREIVRTEMNDPGLGVFIVCFDRKWISYDDSESENE